MKVWVDHMPKAPASAYLFCSLAVLSSLQAFAQDKFDLRLWCEGFNQLGKFEHEIVIRDGKWSGYYKDFIFNRNDNEIWYEEYRGPEDNYSFRLNRKTGDLTLIIQRPGESKHTSTGRCKKSENLF